MPYTIASIKRLATVTRMPTTEHREKKAMATVPVPFSTKLLSSRYLATNSGYYQYVEGGAGNSRLN